MSAIRPRGNKETKLKLASILRAARITGWRRHLRRRLVQAFELDVLCLSDTMPFAWLQIRNRFLGWRRL
jgi:hypothetical protein